jgi:hypothetical protein
MNDRLDKILIIAEELSHTRTRVETTMINLKQQLSALKETIEFSVAELEMRGLDANLSKLKNIEERAAGVSRNVGEIKQQSASLEQALGYIKSAKRLAN